MSESDFDPTNIDSSSEEVLPQKRQRPSDPSKSILPDPIDLLNNFKDFKPIPRKNPAAKPPEPKQSSSAVISKPPTLNKSQKDDLEQYDYFATEETAILDHWKSAQDLPDPYAIADKSKFIKSLKPKPKCDIAVKLQREFENLERAKKGKRQFQKDQERKMRQQYDS